MYLCALYMPSRLVHWDTFTFTFCCFILKVLKNIWPAEHWAGCQHYTGVGEVVAKHGALCDSRVCCVWINSCGMWEQWRTLHVLPAVFMVTISSDAHILTNRAVAAAAKEICSVPCQCCVCPCCNNISRYADVSENVCSLLSSLTTILLFLKALRVSALFTLHHQATETQNLKLTTYLWVPNLH